MVKRTTAYHPVSQLPQSRAELVAAPPKKRKSPVKAGPSQRNPQDEARIAEIFRRFAAADPSPKGELNFVNPFTLLVAVVLSAQATDSGVNKATGPLFALADTPQKMLALGEDKIREMIKTIGLYYGPRPSMWPLCRACLSTISAAKFRTIARLSKHFRGLAARPQMS